MRALIVLLALAVSADACLPRLPIPRVALDKPAPTDLAKTTPESRSKLPVLPEVPLCIGDKALREKVASLEKELADLRTRPAGKDGKDGAPGPAGKDGAAADVAALWTKIETLTTNQVKLMELIAAQQKVIEANTAANTATINRINELEKQFNALSGSTTIRVDPK